MRRFTLVLNIFSAVLFAAFLAYTLTAKAHLDSLARAFVTEKTLEHSAPIIDGLEQALDVPFVTRLFSDDHVRMVRQEIDQYRLDPSGYIADLTGESLVKIPAEPDGEIAGKVAEGKRQIRAFYDDTLHALITDLRIFSGTNLAAAAFAVFLTIRTGPRARYAVILFSFFLAVAVIFCSYLYIDSLSFFRILSASHLGWFYPVFVLLITIYLHFWLGNIVEPVTERKSVNEGVTGQD